MASVRENIMVAVAAFLENLSLGSDATGVEEKINNVEREYIPGETYADLPVAFVLDNRQRYKTGADGAKKGTYDNIVFIRILVLTRAGRAVRGEPQSTTGNRVLEFVTRKVMEEARPAVGAFKTDVPGVIWMHVESDDRSPFSSGANQIAQGIDVSVRFRHSDVDPAVPAP